MTLSLSTFQVQLLLQTYYESNHPHKSPLRIQNVASLTSGWENEIFASDLEWRDGDECMCEPLILRLYAGVRASEKADHEFHTMQRLHESGYPVPLVHILGLSAVPFGTPFTIMERFNGNDLWLTFATATSGRKQALRNLFCELLVRLHALEPRMIFPTGVTSNQPYEFVDEVIHEHRTALQKSQLPELMPYVEWLQARRNLVPCAKPCVVHSDFHYNNVLLRNDDLAMVIDWSGVRISDKRFDMGWMLMLQRTHIDVEERDLLLAGYLRLSPKPLPNIEWFETHAALWRVRHAIALFLHGPEAIGAHLAAIDMVKKYLRPISQAYTFLVASTSIRAASIERVFASQSSAQVDDT